MPPEYRRVVNSPSVTLRHEVDAAKSINPAETTAPARPYMNNTSAMMMPYMMSNMMSMQGGGGGNNPIAWIYSINQMIYSISYALDMIGMNSQQIQNLYFRLYQIYENILEYIKSSKVRKWIQEKSKRSRLFRIFIICMTMIVSTQVARLLQAQSKKAALNKSIASIVQSSRQTLA